MPSEVAEKAIQELKRLEAMPPTSAEATVSRNYLDWLIAVPSFKTKESRDLKRAEQILNEDHYGLGTTFSSSPSAPSSEATILTLSGLRGGGRLAASQSRAR